MIQIKNILRRSLCGPEVINNVLYLFLFLDEKCLQDNLFVLPIIPFGLGAHAVTVTDSLSISMPPLICYML